MHGECFSLVLSGEKSLKRKIPDSSQSELSQNLNLRVVSSFPCGIMSFCHPYCRGENSYPSGTKQDRQREKKEGRLVCEGLCPGSGQWSRSCSKGSMVIGKVAFRV